MLIRLSGVDPEVLRQFRAERGIYFGMATAILSTGAIAGLSMWFALHTALDVPLIPTTIFAAAWALIIMSLDRWLVVSMKRHDWKWWRYFLWASPRLVLAALFGIIISTPITMQIFNSEISAQLVQLHGAALVAFDKGSLVKELNVKIASDKKSVEELTAQSKAGTSVVQPASDPQIRYLQQQLQASRTQEQKDFNAWQCQLYGQVKGSSQRCPPGSGPLSQAARNQYLSDKTQVTAFQNRIKARTNELTSQAAAEQELQENQAAGALPAAEAKLTTDQHQLLTQVSEFSSTNAANNGILERIRALNAAAGTDLGLNLARWLLFLFFLTIDCLPVLTKIFHNIAPEGAYETALADHEEGTIQRLHDDETALTRVRAEAHRRIENEAIAEEEEFLRDEMARRAGRTRRSAAPRGGARRWRAGWPWFRLPNGGARTGGPARPRTVIQQFDPYRANGKGPTP